MVNINRILCPTDFSEFSELALTYAVNLSTRFKAKLYVQHVIEDFFVMTPDTYSVPADLLRTTTAEYEKDIAERLNRRLMQEKDLDYNTLIVRGKPHEEILNAVKAHEIDLVVMGTHGYTGLERLVFGSVTEQVIKNAPCPVLTVCHMTEEELRRHLDFRTILVAVDFSEYSLRALEYALALVEEYRSQLWVLHVVERLPELETISSFSAAHTYQENYLCAVKDRLAQLIPEDFRAQYWVDELVRMGSAHEEITYTARNTDADLVVLGVVGHGAIKSALFGSTAYQVMREVHCPVLTVRDQRGEE